MAVMAYLLREYANQEVDIARVMLMCLIHDIVEIDAGDTYAYDAEGQKTQKAREDAAKERIYSLLRAGSWDDGAAVVHPQEISEGKIVRIGLSGLPLTDHYQLGMMIREAVRALGRRIVFVPAGICLISCRRTDPMDLRRKGRSMTSGSWMSAAGCFR